MELNEGMQMKNEVDNNIELIKKAKDGDSTAQTQMVENNIGLVWSIVKRFLNRGYEGEDLFQIGCLGLVKAIKKFDTSYGVKFSTYAVPMIMGEIKRFMRDDGIIKVSRSLKETYQKIKITKEILSKEAGREASLGEIANRLNIDLEEAVLAMEANNAPESLQETFGEGERTLTLMDTIGNESESSNVEDKMLLKQMLDSLNQRERQIIVLRYFREKTQTEVAAMLGVSQVQISRIEKKILLNMREKILER
jgi:RNA polymerase sporulation-specific sigma factor